MRHEITLILADKECASAIDILVMHGQWSKWGIEGLVDGIPPGSLNLLGYNEPNHM